MIDWTRVGDLRSEIGEDDFLEVVDMFLEEADEVIGLLSGPADLPQVESQLHFLKGSALNLGLTELAALCQTGERSAAMGRPDQVDLPQLVQVYQASRQSLTSALGQPSAQ